MNKEQRFDGEVPFTPRVYKSHKMKVVKYNLIHSGA